MIVKPNDVWVTEFTTENPATHAAADATDTPVGVLAINGVDDGAATVTVTNRATGRYKASVTVPATCAAGDTLAMAITATVATVAGAGIVAHATVDTVRVSEVSAQVGAIGSGTGAALNFEVVADNAGGALNGITKKGTETGTYTNTLANDASVHSLAAQNDAGTFNIDWVYKFACGGGRTASKAVVRAAMAAVGDTVTISAYNFGTTSWDARTTFTGTASQLIDVPLLAGHTGTGANAGVVYLRFVYSAADTGTININEVYCQAQNAGQTVGYSDGSIWVDTVSGTAGTTPFVNGTADKPVLTWADALTLAAAVGIRSFHFLPGSSIKLTGSAAKYRFIGSVTIDMDGNSIADAYFRDAYTVTGVSSGDDAEFINCGIGTCTLAHAYLIDCRFKGVVTLIASQEYFIIRGSDAVTGTSTPAQFTYAANCEIDFRDWRGGVQLNSHVSTNTTFIDGAGRVVIDASSTGGAITVRGHFAEPTGLAAFISAGGTLTDTARTAEDQNITNVTGSVAALATDSVSAAALKTDAVTEIQTGLALEATLTAIKGAGWSAETLHAIYDATAALTPSAGDGANSVQVTVAEDALGASPLQYVTVTMTMGGNTYTQVTPANGIVTFTLVNGDYTLRVALAGWTAASQVVTAQTTPTLIVAMDPVGIHVATAPGTCNCYLYARTNHGAAAPGVVVNFKVSAPGSIVGAAVDGDADPITSDATGLVAIILPQGVVAAMQVNTGAWSTFKVPVATAYELPSIIV